MSRKTPEQVAARRVQSVVGCPYMVAVHAVRKQMLIRVQESPNKYDWTKIIEDATAALTCREKR